MKKLRVFSVSLLFLLIVILISLVSAIRINEAESNPQGDDSGNEWVELFSGNEVNLEGWKLINNDEDEFPLDGTFSGYFIVNFEKQWLDNKDEKIFLYNNTELIDETSIFADSYNNDKSWQLCDEWIFEVSTKKQENNCPEQEIEEAEEEPDEEETDEVSEEETEEVLGEEEPEKEQEIEKIEEIKEESSEVKEKEIIRLGSREEEKSKITGSVLYESSSEKIKKYAIYAFSLLLIVLLIILLIKKKSGVLAREEIP